MYPLMFSPLNAPSLFFQFIDAVVGLRGGVSFYNFLSGMGRPWRGTMVWQVSSAVADEDDTRNPSVRAQYC